SGKLPGRIVRQSGDPAAADGAVNEAYDGAEAVWNLYMEIFRRNSIDGRGMDLNSTIHYGEEFNNAFWDGSQMVYGDGDGRLFGPFTQDVDIIGHELTHGVTQCEAGLQYQFQSGALNESFSDVFGSLVKQYRAKQTAAQADWLIGEKVLLGGGYALRSLKAPGTAYLNHPILGNDPQPAAMSDYRILPAWQDNGGVHINSGIPNHAFYLAAMAIGGYAWEKTGWIWFRALTDYLGPKADFLRAARATVQAARDLYGAGGTEEKAVADAWIEVKVVRDEDQILHHRGVRRFEPVLRD
ncbi:M4 family metallopeptidase, partial [Candidatus Sumerlaeota bacterium]|nr:M4 family metallopeptidase [Candidatus Sumerlaeota bacterium]